MIDLMVRNSITLFLIKTLTIYIPFAGKAMGQANV